MFPILGDSAFNQWLEAMRMTIRLPGGIPDDFRKRLWAIVANQYLETQGINWKEASRLCFGLNSNLDNNFVEEQIMKDLQRASCCLLNGDKTGQQLALLRQLLVAFSRWNKTIGYCQGFDMLGAVILDVMEWDVEKSLKIMIFLMEGILPPNYFCDSMNGLFVDMKVLRDLLERRLPALSKHFHLLQYQDIEDGESYEPPLININTMQWFQTLFTNSFPKLLVHRIWDFILLEGSETLFRTSVEIWDHLSDQIMAADTTDDFYKIMSTVTLRMTDLGATETRILGDNIAYADPFPLQLVIQLRQKYSINRRRSSLLILLNKGIQMERFEEGEEEEEMSEEGHSSQSREAIEACD